MRQAGVLAAAGLVALAETPQRLHLDHENSRYLAGALTELPGIRIDPGGVVTNIVIVDVSGTGFTAAEISQQLLARGILANATSPADLRMVTHYDVNRAGCERAVKAFGEIVGTAAGVGSTSAGHA
ncbi:MAG TPA: beta-eliminating lyase-related protein, partial [Terriglobia bacterium]